MAEPAKATIVAVSDLFSPDARRIGKLDRLVQYEVSPGQRFTVRVPAETFTDDTVRAAIKADLAERNLWQGKSLSL